MPDEIQWEQRDGVLVATTPPPLPPAPTQTPRTTHDLVACPTCHARVDERCRSATGTPRSPHVNRLVSRLCLCGAPLEPRKQLCEWCRRDARKETYARREQRVPTRLRRRAA